jgi:sulfonate transport system substrate-binding protein
LNRRQFLGVSAAAASALWTGGCRRAPAARITVDWAYYSPLSMVLRKHGWLDEALAPLRLGVDWVLSLGSNKALELLASRGADVGSAASAAALLSRANGNPIKAVYVSGRPEWTALVVAAGSPLTRPEELKGKRIAATKGTDPYLVLLRILHDAGLTKSDVELVHLQHPDGRAALERGDVDAWAGLDPHMAASELERHSHLLVRRPHYNSHSVLVVREDFARERADVVRALVQGYERARRWALGHPQELIALTAEQAKIARPVAERVLRERYRFDDGVPRAEHARALDGVAGLLQSEGLVQRNGDVRASLASLFDASAAQQAVAG